MRGVSLFAFILVLTACFSNPPVVNHLDGITTARENEIYVVSHDWHTGLVVPARQIQDQLPELKERFADAPYIEFGWGDKAFYQADKITSGLTLKALFWPTESVVHAVAVPIKANEYYPNSEVMKLCFNNSEYSSLIDFISNSFYKNEKGEIVELKAGIYGKSQFYRGVGVFHLANTCNKWTAKGLQSAGMDISPAFKLTAESVMNYVAAHKKMLSTESSGRCSVP